MAIDWVEVETCDARKHGYGKNESKSEGGKTLSCLLV
jgi:hypothetical protein